MSCLFCNIIKGEIPSKKVYEDDKVLAFEDINPQAPVHVLVIPKLHFKDIQDMVDKNSSVMTDVFNAVDSIAAKTGIKEKGYRVIINNGTAGGQVIWHLHVHILGGKDNMGPMLCKN